MRVPSFAKRSGDLLHVGMGLSVPREFVGFENFEP